MINFKRKNLKILLQLIKLFLFHVFYLNYLVKKRSVFQNLYQQMASLYYARYVLCTCRIFCYESVSIASVHVNDYFILRSITNILAISHVGEQMFYHKRKRTIQLPYNFPLIMRFKHAPWTNLSDICWVSLSQQDTSL